MEIYSHLFYLRISKDRTLNRSFVFNLDWSIFKLKERLNWYNRDGVDGGIQVYQRRSEIHLKIRRHHSLNNLPYKNIVIKNIV